MNTPAVAYRNYFLRCPKSCAIPLPHPNRAGSDGSLQEIERENRRAVFVCPYCGLASSYYGRDILEMLLGTLDLFRAGECALVSTEVECDGKNCEAQKLVHTVQGIAMGTWRPKIAPKDWQFSETALCGAGHKLRLDDSRGVRWIARAEDPF